MLKRQPSKLVEDLQHMHQDDLSLLMLNEQKSSNYVYETVRGSQESSRYSLDGSAQDHEARSEQVQLDKWIILEKHLKHQERRVKQEKHELGSKDTYGRTSCGYINDKRLKQNVANLHHHSDLNEVRLLQHPKFICPDEKIKDSLQCDSSYQKLFHASQKSSLHSATQML